MMEGLKEIVLKAGHSTVPAYWLSDEKPIACSTSNFERLVSFAEALIESYKAELLKEVGEPVAFLHQWIEYHPYGDTVAGEPCSAITNDGKPFDKSDTVTPLFTSDQVAAAIIKATKPLEKEVERLKTVPMKYRRMAFNAQLQDENNELRAQLAAAQEANEHWQRATAENENKWIEANDKLATAEQRVAEACKSMCLRLVRKEKEHAAGYGPGYLNYSAQDVADLIDNGEWRKFVKEV